MNDTLTNTPETDAIANKLYSRGIRVSQIEMLHHARKLERERDEWRSRFSRAVEILEGRLHRADNCLCSGRRDVNNLRALLETTTKPTP